MDHRRWLVAGVSIAGTIALVALLPAVRQLAAAILLLLSPGYAVSLALLPSREFRVSEWATVVLATGAASLAVGGLLVANLPSGVSAEAWVGLTAVLVAAGLLVALFRRRPLLPRRVAGQLSGTSVLVMLVALGIAGGALAAARSGAEEQDRLQTFSELWAIRGADRMLNIGLTSHEKDANTYRVDVELDGKVIAQWRGISLRPGATWDTALAAPTMPDGATLLVLAFLGGDTTPYRSVVLHGPTS
jgi:hypothetical protein